MQKVEGSSPFSRLEKARKGGPLLFSIGTGPDASRNRPANAVVHFVASSDVALPVSLGPARAGRFRLPNGGA